MDPALHRTVEVRHPIGREEHDTTIVLKHTQEHRNVSITSVIQRPLPHEYVSLVQ